MGLTTSITNKTSSFSKSLVILQMLLYLVALQNHILVSFVLNAVNSNVLSQIADDYKNCSKENFQIRITSYTKIIFVLSIFAIFGLIICGYPITLLYGEQYVTYIIYSVF